MAVMKETLNSYVYACKEDPELKSFDDSLYQETSKFLGKLNAQGKTEYSSMDSAMGLCEYLCEVNQLVENVIIESREDVWKNEDLKSLVYVYFDGTKSTLDLLNTVEDCIGKAESIQLTIEVAVEQFDAESVDTGGNKKKHKYEKTLEELNKVKGMRDPFGDEFEAQYESVREQQKSLLEELSKLKEKFGKKYEKAKKWKKLSYVFFAATAVSLAVLSLVGAPLVGVAVAAPVAAAGLWLYNMHNNAEAQNVLVDDMQLSATINSTATDSIYSSVNNLKNRIHWTLKTAGGDVEKRDDVTSAEMRLLKKKIKQFNTKLEEVTQLVADNTNVIIKGREKVLHCLANGRGKF